MHPVNTSIGKKVVHYTGTPVLMGQQAYINVVDHPDFNVGDNVLTSRIVASNEVTGRIETANTIYVPS